MPIGTITHINDTTGHGFIQCGDRSVYLSARDASSFGLGVEVDFTMHRGTRGWYATDVRHAGQPLIRSQSSIRSYRSSSVERQREKGAKFYG